MLGRAWVSLGALLVGLLGGYRLGARQSSSCSTAAPVVAECAARAAAAPAATPTEAFALLTAELTPARLAREASWRRRRAYRRAAPFPHAIFDDLIPRRVVDLLAEEIPEQTDEGGECAIRHSTGSPCFRERGVQFRKTALDSEADMGPATRQVFAFLRSSPFIHFLENLTSVHGIVPDPHYRGSGVHMTAPGGLLGVHADFNRYPKYGLRRRVNTFIFLNPDWPQAYGGELELWSRNMSRCEQRIAPIHGRVVVFSSTDFSYHGHPQPLAAPPGRMRRSLALYYFSKGCPTDECLESDCEKPHTTLWQAPKGCVRCQEATCRAYPDEETDRGQTAG